MKCFNCTYDKARKKRGPIGKRIAEIRRHQNKSVDGSNKSHSVQSPCGIGGPTEVSSPTDPCALALQQTSTLSSNGTAESDVAPASTQLGFWPSDALGSSQFPPSYPDMATSLQQVPTSNTVFSEISGADSDFTANGLVASPKEGEFIFPSLPIDSPSDSFDAFGAILQQDLPHVAQTADLWPSSINEDTLLPWIDVYFKRLHPTIPILNRTDLYREMLLRKHRTDFQYGAMLLGLCAFAMTQPVQIHERASTPSRSAQARMLMEECVKMRVAADFGEYPSIEMILASFFLFACLFGSSQHKAAQHRLREAVHLAYSLGLHLPQSYAGLDTEGREQWLRTYLVLSVTERAYALQQSHSIGFRGRPGATARFMQAFDPTAATEYISRLIYGDKSDAAAMTGLLYMMDTFDAIDESVIECWNGYCKFSDGTCDSFDRRRALQMFRAQQQAREASMTGNISFAPTATPLPLAQLVDSQQADLLVTQFWLLNRLWNLCLSHGLLRESSEHSELRFDFACQVAGMLLLFTNSLPLSAMEVHGVGLVEKVYDIGMGIITAMNSSANVTLDTTVTKVNTDQSPSVAALELTVKELLQRINTLIQSFRGGDHQHSLQFANVLNAVPGYYR